MKPTQDLDPKFEALLDHLRRTRAIDLTGYKRPSLMRRVQKRMQEVNAADYVDYIDYLEVHPEEFTELLNTIAINVTAFFRDEEAWTYLKEEVIPRILSEKKPYEPIRVWCAGCASGEEAYSLLMLFCEAMGAQEVQDRLKIYATDIDEETLNVARQGSYSADKLQSMPAEYVDKYFQLVGDKYFVRQNLRRVLIFGRHDLVQDAPISKLDLLSCRNTLMYFNAEMQRRILSRFHFALNEHGFLFVGKAEMLLSNAKLFEANDLKYRVFAKSSKTTGRERLLVLAETGDPDAMELLRQNLTLKDLAVDACSVSQIAVDVNGVLILANKYARAMFGLVERDLGRPLQDLEISYRPVELRSLIEKSHSQRNAVRVDKVERNLPNGGLQFLDIEVMPLAVNGSDMIGTSITFFDVTRAEKLHLELQKSNQELETANEELQSTHEELETTNEELQSTNEELETTNEELQSTNEELETMNEELQSTNAELETMNSELGQLADKLNAANVFLNAVMTSIRAAVVVLDLNMVVTNWNRKAEELWGLRSDEVKGKKFFDLDIGLPVGELSKPAASVLAKEVPSKELHMKATNRRGKSIDCAIVITALAEHGQAPEGLVFLMEPSQSS